MSERTATTPDFDLTHPYYDELEPIRVKSRDLYSGPDVVKSKGEEYLFKLDEEDPKLYEFRLKRAVYDNWLSPVVEARLALLWRKAPTRDLPARIKGFVENVDGSRRTADAFFESVSENAKVDGLTWVLVDAPKRPVKTDPEGKPLLDDDGEEIPLDLSVAEAEAFGFRARLSEIDASSLINWEFGDDGLLNWAVIKRVYSSCLGPGHPRVEEDRWTVWTQDEVVEYRLQDAEVEKKKDRVYVEVPGSRAKNEIGVVPIVPFYGCHVDDGLGFPVTRDILDHVLAIFNKGSDRDTAEHLTNNPIPVIQADKKPGKLSVTWGSGIFLETKANHPEPRAYYLEARAGGINESRLSERDLIRRIAEISLRQSKRDTAQVQTADSLKAENLIFSSSLASAARFHEFSEEKVWTIIGLFMGLTRVEAERAEVILNKDFDDRKIEAAMIVAFSNMVLNHQLSRGTFWKMLRNGDVLPEDFDEVKELTAIEDDKDRDADLGPGTPGLDDPNANFGDEGDSLQQEPPDDTPDV